MDRVKEFGEISDYPPKAEWVLVALSIIVGDGTTNAWVLGLVGKLVGPTGSLVLKSLRLYGSMS